jgi:hypothetical protein
LKIKKDWLEEGLLVLAKKIKRRIVGEGFSTAQEGGAQQNYVPPFEGTRRVTTVMYQCKHGGVV